MIRLDDEAVTLNSAEDKAAIDRLALLNVLAEAAAASGAEFDCDCRRDDSDALSDGFDLVVASDEIDSIPRGQRRDAFRVKSHELTNRFAWYGVAAVLGPATLAFRTCGAGVFSGHYYAYGPAMNTFVTESYAATWRQSGMDRIDNAGRKAMCESAFSRNLGGRPLISRNWTWRRFPIATTEQSFDDNVVVIEAALRGAHGAIGSGTRLTMGDAAALVTALSTAGFAVPTRLRRFEAGRRCPRNLLSDAARRSFAWYEQVADRMRALVIDFVHGFMTSTGQLVDARLRSYAPEFYEAYVEHRKTVGSNTVAGTRTSR